MILDATAASYGFTLDAICGPSRTRPLVTARQVAMYLVRNLTDYSYPAIARVFGGRDHTTVIHAVDKITTQMKERRQIYEQVTELTPPDPERRVSTCGPAPARAVDNAGHRWGPHAARRPQHASAPGGPAARVRPPAGRRPVDDRSPPTRDDRRVRPQSPALLPLQK